jgi:DNA polymerase III delta subunit
MVVKDFDRAMELAASAAPGAVFLAGGEEAYQAGRLEAALEARARALGLETVRLSADEAEPGRMRRLTSEGSLFSSGRFILVRDAEGFPLKSQPEVLSAISCPGAGHMFLFLTGKPPQSTAFLKKLGAAAAVTFTCWEPFPGRMWQWTGRMSKELGLNLDRQAAETAEGLAFGRLFNLWSVLERLSLRYGSGTGITSSMVLASSGGVPECSALDLSQDAVTGRRSQALEKLSLLLAAGEEPIRLLALIHSQWLLAASAAGMLSRGEGEGSLASSLGISPYRAKWVAEAGSSWVGKPLAPAAEAFARTDQRLKRGWDPLDALVPFVVTLTLPRE